MRRAIARIAGWLRAVRWVLVVVLMAAVFCNILYLRSLERAMGRCDTTPLDSRADCFAELVVGFGLNERLWMLLIVLIGLTGVVAFWAISQWYRGGGKDAPEEVKVRQWTREAWLLWPLYLVAGFVALCLYLS